VQVNSALAAAFTWLGIVYQDEFQVAGQSVAQRA